MKRCHGLPSHSLLRGLSASTNHVDEFITCWWRPFRVGKPAEKTRQKLGVGYPDPRHPTHYPSAVEVRLPLTYQDLIIEMIIDARGQMDGSGVILEDSRQQFGSHGTRM